MQVSFWANLLCFENEWLIWYCKTYTTPSLNGKQDANPGIDKDRNRWLPLLLQSEPWSYTKKPWDINE